MKELDSNFHTLNQRLKDEVIEPLEAYHRPFADVKVCFSAKEFCGSYILRHQYQLSPPSQAFVYGDGVFCTVLIFFVLNPFSLVQLVSILRSL